MVANNDPEPATTTVSVLSPPDTSFTPVWGTETAAVAGTDGLALEVPSLSTVVLRADAPLPIPDEEPSITIVRPAAGTEITTERYRIEAELGDRRYGEVTFAAAVSGGEYEVIGTDDAPPYRVYWSTVGVAAGTTVEFIATVDDGSGRVRSATVDAVVVPAS